MNKIFFRWIGFLIWGALLLSAPLSFAEDLNSPAKSNAFQAATQAYENGLFDVAEQRLTFFLSHPSSSLLRAEALLLRGRSLYYLGRYNKAVEDFSLVEKTLQETKDKPSPNKSSPKQTSFLRRKALFWKGKAELAEKKGKEAEATFDELLSQLETGENQGMVERIVGTLSHAFGTLNPLKKEPEETQARVQLERAWALLLQKKGALAQQVLTQLAFEDPTGEMGQKASLLLAKHFIVLGQEDQAQEQLQTLLTKKLQPRIHYETYYLLGQLFAQQGQHEKALEAFAEITTKVRAFPRALVVESWFAQGNSLKQLERYEEARQSFQQAFTLGKHEHLKFASFRQFLSVAQKMQRLPEAIAELQTFARQNKDQPNAAAALLAIAESLADTGQVDKATGMLESFLTAYPESSWRPFASFLLGSFYRQQGKIKQAQKAFVAGRQATQEKELQHQIDYMLGLLSFEQGELSEAKLAFAQAAHHGGSLGEKALVNLLLTQAQLSDLTAFHEAKEELLRRFPQSSYLAQIPLMEGALHEKRGDAKQAQNIYHAALASPYSQDQKGKLLCQLAELLERQGQWEEASQVYYRFTQELEPCSETADIHCRAIRTASLAGKLSPQQAIEALKKLFQDYPDSPTAPQILLHIGELYYQKGDYARAEETFQQLVRQYSQSDLVDEAYYFAGQAAVAHGNDTDAIAILEKISENSPRKAEARLLQGKIYHRQLKFQKALTIFNAILQREKEEGLFVETMLRKGNCHYAMGHDDKGQYELAASAYGQIINSTQGDIAQRNEAGYRRAKSFEKLGRREDALALYLDVLYQRLSPSRHPQELIAWQNPEKVWQTKAGLEAGRILEEKEKWQGALAVYAQLEILGGPGQMQVRSMINRIRRDHYLYE